MSKKNVYDTCCVDLTYLHSMVSELEVMLTSLEDTGNKMSNVHFAKLSESERVAYVTAVNKTAGLAQGIINEAQMAIKGLNRVALSGPVKPMDLKALANSSQNLSKTLYDLLGVHQAEGADEPEDPSSGNRGGNGYLN